MKNTTLIQIVTIALGLALAACTQEAVDRDSASAAPPAALSSSAASESLQCTPPQRQCVRCDGTTVFCAIRCPECPPPLALTTDNAVSSLSLESSSPLDTSCTAQSSSPG